MQSGQVNKNSAFSVSNGRNGNTSRKPDVTRTTIVIPSTMDQNLEVLRIKEGLTKNELISRALSEFIRAHRLLPDKTPSISVSYSGS